MATGIFDLDSLPPAHLDPDAAKFYEVVDGRIVENLPLIPRLSLLSSFLQALMGPVARSNRLGRVTSETLFLIDHPRNLMRRPDIAFVSAQRWSLMRRVPSKEAWDVVPDLTVEVIGESNSANSVISRIEEYFNAGVSKVWVVYPSTSKIYVYDSPTRVRILQVGDDLDGEEVIPGFRVPLSTLFGRKKKPKRQPKAD